MNSQRYNSHDCRHGTGCSQDVGTCFILVDEVVRFWAEISSGAGIVFSFKTRVQDSSAGWAATVRTRVQYVAKILHASCFCVQVTLIRHWFLGSLGGFVRGTRLGCACPPRPFIAIVSFLDYFEKIVAWLALFVFRIALDGVWQRCCNHWG